MADGLIPTLVRLRLTVWRRTPNGLRPVGVTLGLALAVAALAVGTGDLGGERSTADLLAVIAAAWLVGWVIGPIQTGGADLLRPEWFAMAPLTPRRLAAGLLAASSVSIGAAITAVMLVAPAIYGGRLGAGAVAMAVAALPLLLLLMILASRIVAEALGSAARSRLATELASLQYGLFIAAMLVGWAIISILADVAGDAGAEFADLLPGWLATLVRALPSGWGIVAVEAAGRGDWPLAAAALAGLAAAVWAGLLLWAWLLRRRLTGGRAGPGVTVRASSRGQLPATQLGAVTGKDLRTWLRDPRRGIEVRSSLWAAVFTTAALWALAPEVLPFAGVVVALIGAMACVNVYAMDGTALWLTLLVPGAERADVRGRQLAWLLIYVPATVLPSVVGLAVVREAWPVPWVAALVPALLGGAAGLIPLLSVYGLAPETDAHKRTGNPAETGGDATGLYFAMLFATVLTAAPPTVLLVLGSANDVPALTWLAVPAGLLTGAGCAWAFGRAAYRRLRDRGPELLQLMRVGPRPPTATREASGNPVEMMPRHRQALLSVCVTLGMIAAVPQGIVPAVMKLTGQTEPVWFLALYAPEAWQWPVVVAMVLLGLALLLVAFQLYRTARSGAASTAPDRRP